MMPYIALPELASLVGVSRQAIEKAIALTQNNPSATWRGVRPIVRTVRGRGGRSGVGYQLRVDSLPVEFQGLVKEVYGPAVPQLSHGPAAQADRDFWLHVISPAHDHPKGSRERGEAIRQAAAIERWRPGRKPFKLTERSIQRKLNNYEAHGLGGLSRSKRADAGSRAVIMTRRWDQAVSFDDAEKHRIASAVRDYVRGLHKNAEPMVHLRRLASFKLLNLTNSAGCDLGADATDICRVPDAFIDRERHYRRVALLRLNRKAFEDQKPRGLRELAKEPMAVVYGDVHPVDIELRREDGSSAYARAVGWLDDATRRIWIDLFLFEKGKGISNRHVIQSFINMANAWGLPQNLYLDNGSEYGCAEFIDDAMQIGRNGVGKSAITRAQPYNASAKSIESTFRVLENCYLQAIPGYVGGDRMNKKTANVGRKVAPFSGSFDVFKAFFAAQIHLYHCTPQLRGKLKGRSPDQAYGEAIKSGWTMTGVEADAFRLAFSHKREMTWRQGTISWKANRWTCPELVRWQHKKITALIPKYEDWNRIPLLDRDGAYLGCAERQRAYAPLDRAGAIEVRDMQRAHVQEVIELARSVPDLDSIKERMLFLEAQPPSPVAPIGRMVAASDDAKLILAEMEKAKETPGQRRQRERREVEERVHAQLAAGDAVLERLRRNKR